MRRDEREVRRLVERPGRGEADVPLKCAYRGVKRIAVRIADVVQSLSGLLLDRADIVVHVQLQAEGRWPLHLVHAPVLGAAPLDEAALRDAWHRDRHHPVRRATDARATGGLDPVGGVRDELRPAVAEGDRDLGVRPTLARRKAREPIVPGARHGAVIVSILASFEARAAALVSVGPEHRAAGGGALVGAGARPGAGGHRNIAGEEEHHRAAVRRVPRVTLGARSRTGVVLPLIGLREDEHRVEFAAPLVRALAQRILAPADEPVGRHRERLSGGIGAYRIHVGREELCARLRPGVPVRGEPTIGLEAPHRGDGGAVFDAARISRVVRTLGIDSGIEQRAQHHLHRARSPAVVAERLFIELFPEGHVAGEEPVERLGAANAEASVVIVEA
ncbi:hypothetical protein WME97_15510 [Sorangium sp. So ce367]